MTGRDMLLSIPMFLITCACAFLQCVALDIRSDVHTMRLRYDRLESDVREGVRTLHRADSRLERVDEKLSRISQDVMAIKVRSQAAP